MKETTQALIRSIGITSMVGALSVVPCILCCIYYDDSIYLNSFYFSALIYLLVGMTLFVPLSNKKVKLKSNEGFIVSITTWLFISIFGALPFIFSGYNILPSVFESVSSFTTTGSTVLSLDKLPKALLLWKSILNWVGGIYIVVLLAAISPIMGMQGGTISVIDQHSISSQQISAKFGDTTKFLCLTYLYLSIIEFVSLSIGPLNFFDSIINTFSSISTSGLFVTNSTIDALNTPYTKIVLIIFATLSSLNYLIYFFILNGKYSVAFKNVETKMFFAIITLSSLLIAFMLIKDGNDVKNSILDSVFNVLSFISTSGITITNTTNWPTVCTTILLALLFIGGCSLSTTGSLKIFRILVIFKLIKRGIFKQIHPNATKAIVLNKKPISAKQISSITAHILMYLLIFFFGCILISFNNFDLDITISSVLGVFTNTGIVFCGNSFSNDFSMFSDFSKIVMCLLMQLGRLEIYSFILLILRPLNSNEN